MRKIKDQKQRSKRVRYNKPYFGYCLVFLFTLLVSLQQFSAPVLASSSDESLRTPTRHASAHDQIKSNQSSHDTSLPGSTPVEPLQDESEVEDSLDDEVSKLCGNLFHQVRNTLDAKRCIFSRQKNSIENLSQVSLFILYHCWKVFS